MMLTHLFGAVIGLLRRPWRVVQAAKRLVHEHSIQSLEGIETVAERLGFPVEYIDLPPKVGGFVLRLDDSAPIIAVNRARSLLYQRYTIAHELGHCLFHVNAQRALSGLHADLEADCFAFICLSVSVPDASHIAQFALHNRDLGWRVLPILAYAHVGQWLNRLADWLTRRFSTPHPQGA